MSEVYHPESYGRLPGPPWASGQVPDVGLTEPCLFRWYFSEHLVDKVSCLGIARPTVEHKVHPPRVGSVACWCGSPTHEVSAPDEVAEEVGEVLRAHPGRTWLG